MANTLSGQANLTMSVTENSTATGGAATSSEQCSMGSNIPGWQVNINSANTAAYATGQMTGKATKSFTKTGTIAGSGSASIDLTTITNSQGDTGLTTVNQLILEVATPDGLKTLNFGPQNQANGWQGPFLGAVSAQDGLSVTEILYISNWLTGWAVNSGSKVLYMANPGGNSVTYYLHILGQ